LSETGRDERAIYAVAHARQQLYNTATYLERHEKRKSAEKDTKRATDDVLWTRDERREEHKQRGS